MSDDTTLNEFTESTASQEREETPIGELPTDWGVERLNDIAKINPDGFSEDDWPSETFEYISLSETSDGKIKESKTTSVADAPSRAQRTVQYGDVLVGTVRPKQVSHGLVTKEHDGKICSSGFGVLRTEERLNFRYLLQEILSNRFYSQMEAYVAGSGYPAVKISDLKKHRVAIPSVPEQRKIATVLHTVDQAIQKTEDVIRSLQRILRGTRRDVMKNGIHTHQMSDSDSRFGDVPEVWDIERLDSVTDVTGGSTPSTDESKYWSGEIPWATPTDLTRVDEIKIRDTESHITEEGLNSTSTNLLPPESVLMTSRATIGECAVNTVEMATNQGFQSLVPDESVDTWYLYYRMREEANYLNSLGSGSTFSEVSNTTVQRVKIPIPPIEEQGQIADILKSIDEARIQEEEYKTQLQQLKQGLMQDLLSGEVRTTDANIDIPEEVTKYG